MKISGCEFRTAAGRRVAALLIPACAAFLMAGCGEKKQFDAAAPAAAKVNSEAITEAQINLVLQQQRGVAPQQAETASRQILERLIDQELTVQKAAELKLDREPRFIQQLEAARRDLLSRAYLDKAGEAAKKPAADEVARYYEATPALFKERRIYSLQEIAIEAKPEQVEQLRRELERARNTGEFVEYLKSNDIRFAASQAVRAAEQLPLRSLGTFAAMKDGQAMLNTTPTGAQVIVLAGSRVQSITLEQATPAIEQYLLNERKREILAQDIKALRKGAKIEYVGKYVDAAAAVAPAPDAATSDAAGALSTTKAAGPK